MKSIKCHCILIEKSPNHNICHAFNFPFEKFPGLSMSILIPKKNQIIYMHETSPPLQGTVCFFLSLQHLDSSFQNQKVATILHVLMRIWSCLSFCSSSSVWVYVRVKRHREFSSRVYPQKGYIWYNEAIPSFLIRLAYTYTFLQWSKCALAQTSSLCVSHRSFGLSSHWKGSCNVN